MPSLASSAFCLLPHRIGDLEMPAKSVLLPNKLPHRIGDLENYSLDLPAIIELPHRIGDLEMASSVA